MLNRRQQQIESIAIELGRRIGDGQNRKTAPPERYLDPLDKLRGGYCERARLTVISVTETLSIIDKITVTGEIVVRLAPKPVISGGQPPHLRKTAPARLDYQERYQLQDRLDWLSRGWKEARPHMDISPWMVWGRTTRIHEIFLSVVGRSLGRYKLNFKEYQTLGALILSGAPYQLKPNAIARWNLLTSGGITNLLTRMEKEGLISRAPDPDDGRGVLVQITERGRELFDRAVEEENKIEHELLHVLSPAERETLSGLLRKLLGSIDHDDFGNSEFDGAAPL